MKILILPSGKKRDADDIAGRIPYVAHRPKRREILFLVRVTFAEHKWVTLGERRRIALLSD